MKPSSKETVAADDFADSYDGLHEMPENGQVDGGQEATSVKRLP